MEYTHDLMRLVHDRMYEWSQTLENPRLQEAAPGITVKHRRGDRQADNYVCTVGADWEGHSIRVTYSDYFNLVPAAGKPSWVQDVLEVFVADEQVRFEGILRRRGLSDKLLGLVGARKGLRPIRHELFQRCIAIPAETNQDAEDLSCRRFLDELSRFFGTWACLKLEFWPQKGMTWYRFKRADTLGNDILDESVATLVNLLSSL